MTKPQRVKPTAPKYSTLTLLSLICTILLVAVVTFLATGAILSLLSDRSCILHLNAEEYPFLIRQITIHAWEDENGNKKEGMISWDLYCKTFRRGPCKAGMSG